MAMAFYEGSTLRTDGPPIDLLEVAFTVVAEERMIDALALAEQCMDAWDSYIPRLAEGHVTGRVGP